MKNFTWCVLCLCKKVLLHMHVLRSHWGVNYELLSSFFCLFEVHKVFIYIVTLSSWPSWIQRQESVRTSGAKPGCSGWPWPWPWEWGWLCAPLPHYNPIHSACHLNQQHFHLLASTYMYRLNMPTEYFNRKWYTNIPSHQEIVDSRYLKLQDRI